MSKWALIEKKRYRSSDIELAVMLLELKPHQIFASIWRENTSFAGLSLCCSHYLRVNTVFAISLSDAARLSYNCLLRYSRSRGWKSVHCLCFEKRPSPMPPSSIVAEYAKSNKSACKKCSEKILLNALRLGLVTRDSRGFDMTKWHHLDCFSFSGKSIASADEIKGFSSLKSNDQEALKKLVSESNKPREKEVFEVDCKREGNENAEYIEDEGKDVILKKRKISKSDLDPELNITLSISEVKSKYKDAGLLPKWKAFRTVIFLEQDDGLQSSHKIAAFDFDGCLAKTSVNRVGADAWSLMYPSIPDKLQSLYNDGYKLVIFTNESNIERWKNKRQVAIDSKVGRLNNFINKVKVPVQVFIACGLGKTGKQTDSDADDPFRKPKTGMWWLMKQHFNSGIAIDMDQSFYVGDAAGRPNDHSDADIKFAEVIGLKFYVPEEYFIQ